MAPTVHLCIIHAMPKGQLWAKASAKACLNPSLTLQPSACALVKRFVFICACIYVCVSLQNRLISWYCQYKAGHSDTSRKSQSVWEQLWKKALLCVCLCVYESVCIWYMTGGQSWIFLFHSMKRDLNMHWLPWSSFLSCLPTEPWKHWHDASRIYLICHFLETLGYRLHRRDKRSFMFL